MPGQTEEAARKQHMRTLYKLTRTLCNERPRQSAAGLDKNTEQISEKHAIQSRWTEKFKEFLSREEPENVITEDEHLEFSDTIKEIALHALTASEVN